jgi:hypothetical protein
MPPGGGSLDGEHGWTVRPLVVDTGPWLPGRRVLIPPPAVLRVDDECLRPAGAGG